MMRRRTNESLLDATRLHRQGTGDSDGRKSHKKLRYTIPLRHKRKVSGDEEKGFGEEKGYDTGYYTPLDRGDRENSRGSSAFLPSELLEIVSTNWVSDEDGREIVTLTTKDGALEADQTSKISESQWAHIQSDGMTFNKFYKHVMDVPGLEDDDLALVFRLLKKVRKTSEKQFVHGKYLKPLTMVYDGEDLDGVAKVTKTVTFVSLPIFTTEGPRKHKSTREDDFHPVRALLQSRYRLESTRKRDSEQVITKSKLHRNHDHVIHVPQIWAVIVNKHTIITYAPLGAAALRGDTIKLMSYAEARLDEATWSVQFTDAKGNVSYIPLRYVKSFFSLVKHISDDILHDEYNLIRDQLLKEGPLYKLVTRDDTLVTAESWPKLVKKKKTEIMQLRLIDNQGVSNRLLVTYCDSNGNEVEPPSASSSDTSYTVSSDDDGSDTSEAPTQSPAKSEAVARAMKKLRSLQVKLKEADNHNDTRRAEYLRNKRIPSYEQAILELMAEDVDMEILERRQDHQKDKVTILESEEPGRKALRRLDDPPLSSEPRLKPRSISSSARRKNKHPRTDQDLSLDQMDLPGRQRQSKVIQERRPSVPGPHPIRKDDHDVPKRSQRLSPTQLQLLNGRPWSGGEKLDQSEDDLYYEPSEKYLARSRRDFERSRVLSGGALATSDAQVAEAPSTNKLAFKAPESLSTTFQILARENNPPIEQGSPIDTLRNRPVYESAKNEGKKATFGIKSQEVKPRLKNPIKVAQEGAPISPGLQTQATTSEVPIVRSTQDIPIFLWSIKHSTIETSRPLLPSASANGQAGVPTKEINRVIHTSQTQELILHTVTTEVHAFLKRSTSFSPDYYGGTVSRTLGEVMTMMNGLISGASDPLPKSAQACSMMSIKQGILDSAIKIIYAFVPDGYEAAVVSKYWGGIYNLLLGQDEEVLRIIGARLAEMCVLLRSIHMGVRTDDESKQARYQIPRSLPSAFRHIVMSLVVFSQSKVWYTYSLSRMQSEFNTCKDLLVDGRQQLILMVHTDDHRESAGFQAVDSEALLSLIMANLVDNLAIVRDSHLTEVYSEYTIDIQSVVRDQASVKVYDDIKFLAEELDVIKATLVQQHDTLWDFKRTMNMDHDIASLSISVIDRMLESIAQRIDDFEELHNQAETVRYLAQQSISLKAESNNKAIIVFTVVTIIFLPLSFTLFWAIGAPMAFVTLSVALVAAFYGTLVQRFTGWARRDKDKVE